MKNSCAPQSKCTESLNREPRKEQREARHRSIRWTSEQFCLTNQINANQNDEVPCSRALQTLKDKRGNTHFDDHRVKWNIFHALMKIGFFHREPWPHPKKSSYYLNNYLPFRKCNWRKWYSSTQKSVFQGIGYSIMYNNAKLNLT